MTETITQRQLNRTLLARQMLLDTVEAETRDAIEAEGTRLLRVYRRRRQRLWRRDNSLAVSRESSTRLGGVIEAVVCYNPPRPPRQRIARKN